MLKNCGLGVCMANGQDKTKEAADMICGDNDYDVIAYALEKILERWLSSSFLNLKGDCNTAVLLASFSD